MTEFSIAKYFSEGAREKAAAELYRTVPTLRKGTFGRTKAGCCPVGVLLREDGYGAKYTQPDGAYATAALVGRLPQAADLISGRDRRGEIWSAVTTFITAFDAGEIDDLGAALGVGG